MRVKLGKKIYECAVATHTPESRLITLTTPDGVYTVDMKTVENAKLCHERLFKLGLYDFSEY